MRKKIDIAYDNFKENVEVLMCPLCQNNLTLFDKSLRCSLNHTFNINKKGIVSFAIPLSDKIYNGNLFNARRQILESSIYKPFIEVLSNFIKDHALTITDIGCGEGTYLKSLNEMYPSNKYIGIDLSKDALNIASDYSGYNLLLADLAKLPLQDTSVDVLLNILTPANYSEFNRVLKDDGILIKVVAKEGYLKELRDDVNLDVDDNRSVEDLLNNHMHILDEKRVTYTTDVHEDLEDALFKMTPMTSFKTFQKDIQSITIDLKIIICKKKEG